MLTRRRLLQWLGVAPVVAALPVVVVPTVQQEEGTNLSANFEAINKQARENLLHHFDVDELFYPLTDINWSTVVTLSTDVSKGYL